MREDDAAINQYVELTKNLIAIILAILDVILIFITLMKHVPALEQAVVASYPGVFLEPGLWTVVAETIFICAILVTLYGFISLWLPEMHFILWAGAGLAILAGSVYLLASVTYYQSYGMGAPIQQGGFMFLLGLTFPFLVYSLIRRINRRARASREQISSKPEAGEEIAQFSELIPIP